MTQYPDGMLAPGMPRDADGPVFGAPWQAQAFAMTLALHEKGLFSWSEWAETLAAQIQAAQAAGDPDAGDTYYRHWLAALETLVVGGNPGAVGDAWEAALERLRQARSTLDVAWRAADAGDSAAAITHKRPSLTGYEPDAPVAAKDIDALSASFDD